MRSNPAHQMFFIFQPERLERIANFDINENQSYLIKSQNIRFDSNTTVRIKKSGKCVVWWRKRDSMSHVSQWIDS